MHRGTRLRSQSQRAALRATILFSPRKTVSFIQTTRCAMQHFEPNVMQRVELITFPCMPARPSQLDEAAKALHAMRVFAAFVARRPGTFMSRLKRLLPTQRHGSDQVRASIAHYIRSPAARPFCTPHLAAFAQRDRGCCRRKILLQFRRRCMSSAVWGVLLCNKRDRNCTSAAHTKTKQINFTSPVSISA